MKILFLINSPTDYQLDFFYQLKKKNKVYLIYKNQNQKNYNFKLKKKNWIFFLKKKKIYNILEKIHPNIIIIGGYKNDIDLSKLKVKKIKKFFWLERVNEENKIKNFFRNYYLKFRLKTADGIFAIGKYAVKFYKKFNTNVYNIPYSINVKKKIKNYNSPKFLYVGQIIKRKGIGYLLDNIKNIKNLDCSFTFVGDGPLKKKIIRLSRIKKNIFYYRFKNKKGLDKIYRKHNILILPSKFDGWGVVIIEAMARGMAIISNKNVGSVNEYLKHNFNARIFNKKQNLEQQINFYNNNINKIELFGKRNIKIFKSNLCNCSKAVSKINEILRLK